MKHRITIIFLISLTLSLESIAQSKRIKTDQAGIPLAAPEAAVDHVAYSYQRRAIVKLKRMIEKRSQKAQESALLDRLSSLQIENAEITFRIAHSEAYFQKKPINLRQYHQILKESISTLNTLIKRYPKHSRIDEAYYRRGKSYEELGQVSRAKNDYLYLVKYHLNFNEMSSVFLSLADFSEQDGNYVRAIQYLQRVARRKNDQEYPFALFRLAWAYYHLNHIDQTFVYAKTYLSYYDRRLEEHKKSVRIVGSEQVLRDDMLKDSVRFYIKGFKQKLPQYSISNAIEFYRGLARGPRADEAYGEMLVRTAKLLRADGFESALKEWKDQTLRSEEKRPQTLEVVLIAYEDQLNKHRYRQLLETSGDIVGLYQKVGSSYSFDTARNQLLDSATKIQKMILENVKKKTPIPGLNLVLIGVYNSFLKVIDEKSDPRAFRVHYNLAESFSNLKGEDKKRQSISHYQWVFTNANAKKGRTTIHGVDVIQSIFKASSLRYDELKAKGVIPKKVELLKLSDQKTTKLDPDFTQWTEWIELWKSLASNSKQKKGIDFYEYERNRSLYVAGHIQEAIKKLDEFILASPQSKYSQPSASLILDTFIASSAWQQSHDFSRKYLRNPAWRGKKFSKRLYDIAADSAYKITEDLYNHQKYKEVLDRAEDFNESYGNSKKKSDWLNIVSRSALAVNEKKKAMTYFSRLIDEAPQSSHFKEVLLLRAKGYEQQYEFTDAARDYRGYLKIILKEKDNSKQEVLELRKKILLLTWISGNEKDLINLTKDQLVCVSELTSSCDLYFGLAHLNDYKKFSKADKFSLAESRLKSKESSSQAFWVAMALENQTKFNLDQNLKRIRILSQEWAKLDPMVQLALASHLTSIFPRVFEEARAEVSRLAPVRADPNTIKNRVAFIQKVENAASSMASLPWTRPRVSVLNVIADLYIDLSTHIQTLPVPEGLEEADLKSYLPTMQEVAKPFEQTGREIRAKAFSAASQGGIEDVAFKEIARAYFNENPEQSRELLENGEFPIEKTLSIKLLEEWDGPGDWDDLDEDSSDITMVIKAKWAAALGERQWPVVAYFLNEAEKTPTFNESVLGVMKGVALSVMGARSEALDQIEQVRQRVKEGSHRDSLTITLIRYYLNTFSREKISKLLSEIDRDEVDASLSSTEMKLIARFSGEKK